MNQPERLKPVSFFMSFIFPILCALLVGAAISIGFGENSLKLVMSAAMLLPAWYNFLIVFRTKNLMYAAPMFFNIFVPLTFMSSILGTKTLTQIFAVIASIFCVLLFYMLFTKRLKFWDREILELAARPVLDTADGFTPRPFHAGNARCTRSDLEGMADYMMKNLICFPYPSDDGILYVISSYRVRHFLYLQKNFLEETYVSFTNDGEVTVNITQTDYLKYKDQLTFDRLCQSLGDLFKEFLFLYQNDREDEIRNRLDSLHFLP